MKIHISGVYLIFSKKSATPEIVEKFNRSLAEIKKKGTYDKIIQKYRKSLSPR